MQTVMKAITRATSSLVLSAEIHRFHQYENVNGLFLAYSMVRKKHSNTSTIQSTYPKEIHKQPKTTLHLTILAPMIY